MKIILRKQVIILFVMAYLPVFFASAGDVTVKTDSSEWTGTPISFYRYADLVTETELLLAKTVTDNDGGFEVHFPVEKTTLVFARLGVFMVSLYAEPGKVYEVILPPEQQKRPEDLLNPYFEELFLQLGVHNLQDDDINVMIRMFNDTYNPYYNKHVREVLQGRDFSSLDADIQQMEKSFASNTNTYFKNYRKYRYATLRYLAMQHKVTGISEQYFAGNPVLYDNQAYMDLFHQVFNDYFLYHGRTKEGEKIYSDINTEKDYGALRITLKKNKLFSNDSLLELVILKCLYDEFYNDKFSRSGILAILDTLAARTSINESRLIAENIRKKITNLLSGYFPPYFELYDPDSNLVSPATLKGKYVYLNFCTCSSYTCLKEFEILRGINQRQKERLEIVTISADDFDTTLVSFLNKNKYSWKFLYYGNQPGILKDYDIRAYPTYFLIGPDGKLVLSPAPAPEENFEAKFFEILKSRGDL